MPGTTRPTRAAAAGLTLPSATLLKEHFAEFVRTRTTEEYAKGKVPCHVVLQVGLGPQLELLLPADPSLCPCQDIQAFDTRTPDGDSKATTHRQRSILRSLEINAWLSAACPAGYQFVNTRIIFTGSSGQSFHLDMSLKAAMQYKGFFFVWPLEFSSGGRGQQPVDLDTGNTVNRSLKLLEWDTEDQPPVDSHMKMHPWAGTVTQGRRSRPLPPHLALRGELMTVDLSPGDLFLADFSVAHAGLPGDGRAALHGYCIPAGGVATAALSEPHRLQGDPSECVICMRHTWSTVKMEHHPQCLGEVCIECFRLMVRLGNVVACPLCMRVQDVIRLLVGDETTSLWSRQLVDFAQHDFPAVWQVKLVPHLRHHDVTILDDASSYQGTQPRGARSECYGMSRHLEERLLDFVSFFSMRGLARLPLLNQHFSAGIALSDFSCDATPLQKGTCDMDPSSDMERAAYQYKGFPIAGHPFYAGVLNPLEDHGFFNITHAPRRVIGCPL